MTGPESGAVFELSLGQKIGAKVGNLFKLNVANGVAAAIAGERIECERGSRCRFGNPEVETVPPGTGGQLKIVGVTAVFPLRADFFPDQGGEGEGPSFRFEAEPITGVGFQRLRPEPEIGVGAFAGKLHGTGSFFYFPPRLLRSNGKIDDGSVDYGRKQQKEK